MKPYLFHIGLLFAIIGFSSCGPEPPTPPTPEEEVTALLIGSGSTPTTWKIQSVTVNNVDKSSLFTGMTIKFTDGSFTTTNGSAVWPASGTWSFTSAQAVAIKRNDNLEVQVQATTASLKLTLTWNKTTFEPGRTESIAGQHVFTFAP